MALIYVVEDDENIREIEGLVLKNAGYEVQGYPCASDFYSGMKKELPSMILLDIMLPDEDGLSIIKKLRSSQETAQIPVIMATAKASELDKVRGLDFGADDYVTKPFGVMELISRVKAVMRRSYPLGNEHLLQNGKIFMDDTKRAVYVDDEPCELTYKEFELLKLLMKSAGNVVSREDILRNVWGTEYSGESRTLDMHIKTLRKKLGESGHMIRTVRNVGYVMEEEG
ncbi:MAG: winged helix-turn-helix domain-containing protein [Muricoprocola sp.]